MAKRAREGEPIVIKKYANRRLYNTDTSSYITLEDLARMTRENIDFSVVDAKSGDDITHTILTQIIVEQESTGAQMLPVSFLRDLISMYG
ncbi:MAG: polyhydroxyalkanoate synthesis repressor PhaR, partial [Alphaproteobacteria bacterium]|nr:polyhydroxyalkanoate synthesis repressor PhaR [Alphaproteobacteria bacterium]